MAFAANANQRSKTMPSVRTRTPLPLDNGVTAQIISFKNLSDSAEHVALVFPGDHGGKAPLVRVHSKCITGEVFHSARCDCGDQINEAIDRMSKEGGILLYLDQEGRGIGLYNKIDAYAVQDQKGLDTYAANEHLGFEEDERSYAVGAEMLRALDVTTIRLLTGNPKKVSALRLDGITVDEVIPTGKYEKDANRAYLKAKQDHGHTF